MKVEQSRIADEFAVANYIANSPSAGGYAPSGPEITVNNVTLYTQSRADFARLADGNFVAVWESTDAQQDSSSSGIKGRVMAANGAPVGPEFLINTATANAQTYASVAGLAGGGFVVTWTTRDALQDGSYDSIKAQRFDAAGLKVGPEFLVNSQANNIQWISSVAALDNGGFVIAWETYDSAQDGSGRAIKAQLYDAAGAKTGGEFLVNTVTASDQMNCDISTLSDGRFIVTWLININGKLDVRAQVFNSAGAKLGGEIFVNSQTFESQTEVSVTNLANGGFVISWTTFDTTQDGSGSAIKAQVFDAAGAKVGGELLVNTAGAAAQKSPSVAGLSNGDFVIAWRTDDQTADDASGAIKAQVFAATGAKLGGEFRVNSAAASLESDPTVVDLGNGAFAIGWTGSSAPAWDNNIRAQILSSGSAPVIQSNGGGDSAALLVAENMTAVTTVQAFDPDGSPIAYSIAGGADAALFAIDGASGALAFVAAPDFEAPADADGDNVYEVVVRASDGERFDEQALAVAIESANSAVVIVSDGGGDSAALGVAEGSTYVTTVAATDGDGDPILYAIAGGADAARFTIDAGSGVLAFAAAPNHEAPTDANGDNFYEVIVRASDGQLTDSQALAISVGDVNEAPVITFYNYPASDTLISSMPEGWTNYAPFGAADPDGDTLGWTLSGEDAALFTYDAATGWLRFNAAPDYEAAGSGQGTNTYRVTLSTSDGALTDSVGITIHISNVNEGLAITSLGGGDTAAVTVDENAVEVATISALDLDGDASVFSISGGADAQRFVIDATTGALAFAAAPDHEAPADADGDNVYEVIVAASDGYFVDSQAIHVSVAGLDEAVAITSMGGGDSAAVTLGENGTEVGIVSAVDIDGDPVAYAIAGGGDAGLFAIDAETGALSFIAAPDFEAPADAGGDNVYDVIVSASAGATSDMQTIAVTVTDVDEDVVIVSGGGGDEAAVSIDENEGWVLPVLAVGPDGSTLHYGIAGGADAALFALDAYSNTLRFVDLPDYETPRDADGDNVYEVVVGATDGRTSDYQTVFVTVGNVYEGVFFPASPYAFSIDENAVAVGAVLATGEERTTIYYAISGGADANRFTIDGYDGTLRLAETPDFELPADWDGDNVYDLIVTAYDGTSSAYQFVSVTVGNVDEGVWIVSYGGDETVSLELSENGLAVGQIEAVDEDGDPVAYAIAGGADAALFTIDATSGALSFIAAPDFEAPADAGGDNVYDVVVAAASGAFSATQAFAVTIVNENEGIFITSNEGGISAALSMDEGVSHVTTVVADDPDGTAPVYSILGGPDALRFTIDAATGVLSFVDAPDYEAPADQAGDNLYTVQVGASDGEFTSWQSIQILVRNVNEGVTITSGAAASLGENGTAVTVVTAADADGDAVAFSIAGGADAALFAIDAATGALSFLAAPDFEAPGDADGGNVYEVTVSASDGTLSDTRSLSVTVANQNEAVAFVSGGGGDQAAVSIDENEGWVLPVLAVDPDGTTPLYGIAGGADAALFVLDSYSDMLRFVGLPDFETPGDADGDNVYEVVLGTTDGQTFDYQTVFVTVGNVYEGLFFPASPYAFSLDENATAAGTVLATGEQGASVYYSISGGADADRFTIDALTGALSLADAPDFELPADWNGDNVYDVIVRANDGTASAYQFVSVTVGNVDEGVAIVSHGGDDTVWLGLWENSLTVAQVEAVDEDGDPVTYAIAGGADAALFAVDAATGALSFVAGPNYEAPADADGDNRYQVAVAAASGAFSDTQVFEIQIMNVNEPVAISSNGGGAAAAISVVENSATVTTVVAADPEGAPVNYSIVSGGDASRFAINSQTGLLYFVTAPDHELPGDANGDNVYGVTVRATAGQHSDLQTLTVTVTNMRDGNNVTGTMAGDTITGSGKTGLRTSNEEDTVYGRDGNDTIQGLGGEDYLHGDGGNDSLTGGAGADRLTGGTGADQFIYTLLSDSTVSARDVITDFVRAQGDRISLSTIDANSAASGNQAFAFIGSSAFSNVAGQLRFESSGGNTIVSGDVNGDGVADLQIQLTGTINLVSSDFFL